MSELTSYEQMAIWAVLGISLLGLAYAYLLRNQILREDKGTAKMQEIWGWIKDGANAYLSRQLRSILPFIVVLTIALFFSVYIVPPSAEAMAHYSGATPDQVTALYRPVARLCLCHGRDLLADRRPDRHAHGRARQRARRLRRRGPASATRCASPTAPAPSPAC